MLGYIRINTDAFVAHLTRAKMPKAQAEAVAHAIEREIHVDNSALATKSDLKHEIELVRKDIALIEERMMAFVQRSQLHAIVIITGILGVLIAALGVLVVLVLG